MLEAKTLVERRFVVKARPEAALALLGDPRAAQAHLPGVASVEARDGGHATMLKKVGAGPVSFTPLYIARYETDVARATVTWQPVGPEGGDVNTFISGTWRVAPHASGAEISLRNETRVRLPVPGFLRRPLEALMQAEGERQISGYVAGLTLSLEGGDGRRLKTVPFPAALGRG